MKVRVNLHGLFTIASASLTEKKETVEEPSDTMETEEKTDKVRERERELSPLNYIEEGYEVLSCI